MPRNLGNFTNRGRWHTPNPLANENVGLIADVCVNPGNSYDLLTNEPCIPSANLAYNTHVGGGTSLVFNGSDTFLDLPFSRIFQAAYQQQPGGNQDASISTWAYFNSTAQQLAIEMGSDLNGSIVMGWGIDGSAHLTWMHGNDFVATSTYTPPTLTWLHLGMRRKHAAQTVEYFVNGVSQGTFSYTKSIGDGNTKTCTLGTRGVDTPGSTSGRGLHFNGQMADIRLYGCYVHDGVFLAAYQAGTRNRSQGPWFTPPVRLPIAAPATDRSDVYRPVAGGPIRFAPYFIHAKPQVPRPGPPPETAPSHDQGQRVKGGPMSFGPFANKVYAAPPNVPLPEVGPQQYAPEVQGGPRRGTPYHRLQIEQPPPLIAAPAPPVGPQVPPIIVSGGPIVGAPYFRRHITQDNLLNIAPPPPPPQVMPPSVVGGPIIGAPWHQLKVSDPPRIVPPVIQLPPQVQAPPITAGPMQFGPFGGGRLHPAEPIPGPAPPVQPTIPTGVLPPVPQVPTEDKRMFRFTQVVSNILNALVRRGELVQVTTDDWTLAALVLSFNGRTGDVTFTLADMPLSGVVAGDYFVPSLTVDDWGRITAITSLTGSAGVPLVGADGDMQPLFSTQFVAIDSRAGIVYSDGGSGGGTVTFDIRVSDCHSLILTGNPTLAIINDTGIREFTVILIQDGSGSHTVTWFGGIKWAGGSPPTLTSGANKTDVFSFINLGGQYLGYVVGQNF